MTCVEGERLEEVAHPQPIRASSHKVFITGSASLCGALLWTRGVGLQMRGEGGREGINVGYVDNCCFPHEMIGSGVTLR